MHNKYFLINGLFKFNIQGTVHDFLYFPERKAEVPIRRLLEGSNNKNKDASFMISGKESAKGNGLINGQPKIDPDSLNNVRIIRKDPDSPNNVWIIQKESGFAK